MANARQPWTTNRLADGWMGLWQSPAMLRLKNRTLVNRFAVALRAARCTDHPVTFLVREFVRAPSRHRYRLTPSGLLACLRHNGWDAHTLMEIFSWTIYEPPPAVSHCLDSCGPIHVLDLGGNVGLFALWVLTRFPGCIVTSYEPDPENLCALRRTIELNGLADRWSLVQAYASSAPGTVPFAAGLGAVSRMDLGSVLRVESRDVFPDLDRCRFAKIDIEGGEWSILCDKRFQSLATPLIALEYHAIGCPDPDARSAAVARLEEAGFVVHALTENANRESGTLWAIRNGP